MSSPVTRAVLGRRAGDIVDVAGPVGRYRAQILAVERAGMPVGPTSQRDESDDEECATGSPVAPGAPLSRSLDQRCPWSGAAGPSGPAYCCSLRALSCSPPSMRGHNAGWPASGNARGGPPDGSEFVVRLTAGQVGPEVPLTAVRGLTSAPDPERRRRAWRDADPQAPGRAGAFAVEAVARAARSAWSTTPAGLPRAGGQRHPPHRRPVELTVDVGDDLVRDDDASLPGSGRVVAFELREASTDV